MPRRLVRYSLALILLLSSQAFALGLGEIVINSALNEPLRADIELLSATPEELDALKVVLASEATFERYGLDRPFYLTELEFELVRSGRSSGNYVRVSSSDPMTEPFLTFLIEATWSSGRLLREYTVLLDPPTFAPPAATQPAPAVTAPQSAEPADSGRIERTPPPEETPAPVPAPVRPAETTQQEPAPPAEPEPVASQPEASEPPPVSTPEPVVEDRESAAEPAVEDEQYASTSGGDLVVQRGDTLWGIASRMRPDSRLGMNQTMLAIFEANPEAFDGNINRLRAGASLRMPSADDIFRIDRGEAVREAERQHAEWDSGYTPAPQPEPVQAAEPSLQLVPPDEDLTAVPTGTDSAIDGDPLTREQEVLDRIAELEAQGVTSDSGLIEIRDNELASLREELARIRGEVYEPPVDDVAEDPFADTAATDDAFVDESAAGEDAATDDAVATDAEDPTGAEADDASTIQATPVSRRAPSLMDRILGWVTSIYAKIGAIVLIAVGLLLWFLRRDKDESDPEDWQPLGPDSDELDKFGAAEPLEAGDRVGDTIVVVEQEPALGAADPTIESPAYSAELPGEQPDSFDSLEDTFTSETAVNLEQSDPLAEADFHMAYGLYDQAADLVKTALDVEPGRQDLISKLCEVYFVWGNRDAFVDAAGKLKAAVGNEESAEWDKIVIMGQQIAGDNELFVGAGTAAATQAMDLSLDADDEGTSALDMDFGDDSNDGEFIDLGADPGDVQEAGEDGDVIDLGADQQASADADDAGVDFLFEQVGSSTNDSNVLDMDFESIGDSGEAEASGDSEVTRETDPLASVVDSPTIEEQFDISALSDLPAEDDAGSDASTDIDSTAEISLDDLDLDISGLEDAEPETFAGLDVTGANETIDESDIEEALTDVVETTAQDLEVEIDATGEHHAVDDDDIDVMGLGDAFDIDDVLSRTGTMRLAPDETGVNPMILPVEEATDVGLTDAELDEMLAATGKTQVLPEDIAVQTGAEGDLLLGDDEVTLLAGLENDQGDPDQADEGAQSTVTLSDDEVTLLADLESADASDEDEQDDVVATATLDDEDAPSPAGADNAADDFDFAKTEALPVDAFTGTGSGIDETGEMPIVGTDVDLDVELDDLTAALDVSVGGDTVEMPRTEATVEQPRPLLDDLEDVVSSTLSLAPDDLGDDLDDARTMTEVGTKLDLARAYVDMGDPGGARSILEEVLDEGDDGQRQQAKSLLDTLPA